MMLRYFLYSPVNKQFIEKSFLTHGAFTIFYNMHDVECFS